MKIYWKLLGVMGLIAGATAAHAQVANPIAGTINAQLILSSGCAINSGSGSTAGLTNFGMLDFGTQPAGFTGTLNASTSGSGSAGATQVTCSSDLNAVNITVDGGLHAGQGASVGTGTRAMSNGTDYVPYEVYSDSGDTTQYVAGTTQNVTIPAAGQAFTLPVYGLVNKTSAAALSTGTYTDTLNVTLGW